MSTVVALASTEPSDALVRYLEEVGFDVTPVRTPSSAPREGILVWLPDRLDDDRAILDSVRIWLGSKSKLRAIIVTERPIRLKEIVDGSRGRVCVLPAPVFSWQLVDALRDDTFKLR